MERKAIFDRVGNCLKEISLGKITSINCTDRLTEDLGIDSMGATDMVFSLEDEFAVEISDQELLSVKTIDDVVELILLKKKTVAN